MATNTASATARFVRVAPNKIRQVAGFVRGSSVEEARRLLRFSPKGAAQPLLKALDSAVANAENVHDLDADELVVMTVAIDEGPTLRRFRPRAMGRAYRIRKRTSHITVTVGLDPQATQRRTAAKKATTGQRGRRSTRKMS